MREIEGKIVQGSHTCCGSCDEIPINKNIYRMEHENNSDMYFYYLCSYHKNDYKENFIITVYEYFKKPHVCKGLILCKKCIKNIRKIL